MKEISLNMVDKSNLAPYKNITVKDMTYTFCHQIAKGHFSTIFKATDIWKNNLVVKIYDDKINEKLFDNEIKQLKRFASPNVVFLYEAFSYEKFHFLIMENFGVAVSRIKTQNFDTKVKIFLECARSLLQTLNIIHKQGYIHGDINPQNLLINIQDNKLLGVKLCDFSFCRKEDTLDKDYMSIANWVYPPEYFSLGIEKLSTSMDIYHAALVLFSILSEEKLNYTVEEILSNKPQIDVLNSDIPQVKVLASALEINPNNRSTALELWKNLINSLK
jgi:serine/threonine protein kinase